MQICAYDYSNNDKEVALAHPHLNVNCNLSGELIENTPSAHFKKNVIVYTDLLVYIFLLLSENLR